MYIYNVLTLNKMQNDEKKKIFEKIILFVEKKVRFFGQIKTKKRK
jgi:hypothetical protein